MNKFYDYFGRMIQPPEGYDWIFTDRDGTVHAYKEPPPENSRERWGDRGYYITLSDTRSTADYPNYDWRESLRRVDQLPCYKRVYVPAESSAIVSIQQLKAIIWNAPEYFEFQEIADMCGYSARLEDAEDHFDNEAFNNGRMDSEEIIAQWQPPVIEGWELMAKVIDLGGDVMALYVRPKEVSNEKV